MTEYLTTTEVAAKAGCSERNIYRLRKRPDFPRPVQFPFPSRVLFDAREVEDFLRQRERAA